MQSSSSDWKLLQDHILHIYIVCGISKEKEERYFLISPETAPHCPTSEKSPVHGKGSIHPPRAQGSTLTACFLSGFPNIPKFWGVICWEVIVHLKKRGHNWGWFVTDGKRTLNHHIPYNTTFQSWVHVSLKICWQVWGDRKPQLFVCFFFFNDKNSIWTTAHSIDVWMQSS